MLGSTVVIGLGQFGSRVATSLVARGGSVIAIDDKMSRIERIAHVVERAVCIDATDEDALIEAGVPEAAVAVCALGEDAVQGSIMVTALLAQFGIPKIIARSMTDLHSRILRKVGAHEVFNPEHEMGDRLALRLASPGLLEQIPLAENISIGQVVAPNRFVGKTILQIDVRKRFGVNVVAIGRKRPSGDREKVIANPGPDQRIEAGDILFVLGEERQIFAVASGAKVVR